MTTATPRTSRGERRRIVLSSLLGNIIEWYDFYIYSISAALFFPAIFFPGDSDAAGTLASFGILAGGFLVRPIGGLIGGHIGDRHGRKKVLVGSMVGMGVSTVAVGLLPGHVTIGIWAAILLVAARLVQGIAAGAEYGGSVLMVVEHFPVRRRGFWASLGNTGVFAGGVFATLTFAVIASYPPDVQQWLWRVPFLASAVLVVVGLWIRLGVSETPAFKAAEAAAEKRPSVPAVEILKNSGWRLLGVIAVATAASLPYQIYITYGTAYTRLIQGDVATVLLFQTFIGFLALVLTPLFGWLSDLVGRRKLTAGGVLFVIPWTYVLFDSLNAGDLTMVMIALIGCEIGHCMAYGPLAAFLAERFDTRTRYTGTSLGYQVSGAICGLAPLAAAAILTGAGGPPHSGWVPIIVVVSAVAGLAGLAGMREMAGRPLTGSPGTAPASAPATAH